MMCVLLADILKGDNYLEDTCLILGCPRSLDQHIQVDWGPWVSSQRIHMLSPCELHILIDPPAFCSAWKVKVMRLSGLGPVLP